MKKALFIVGCVIAWIAFNHYSFSPSLPQKNEEKVIVEKSKNYCDNDGICEIDSENEKNCAEDCGKFVPMLETCGNGERNIFEDAWNCPEDIHPEPVINLGEGCIGLVDDYLGRLSLPNRDGTETVSRPGKATVQIFTGPEGYKEVILTKKVKIGDHEYFSMCNGIKADGLYRIAAMDFGDAYWFWGKPENFAHLTAEAKKWIRQDPYYGSHDISFRVDKGKILPAGNIRE